MSDDAGGSVKGTSRAPITAQLLGRKLGGFLNSFFAVHDATSDVAHYALHAMEEVDVGDVGEVCREAARLATLFFGEVARCKDLLALLIKAVGPPPPPPRGIKGIPESRGEEEAPPKAHTDGRPGEWVEWGRGRMHAYSVPVCTWW